MAQIGVGIIGFGKVGTGTAKNLVEKSKLYRERYGLDVRLRAVCDVDVERQRPFRVDRKLMTSNVASVLSDPRTHIVVETMGGTTAAKDIVLEAIAARKHVVTANKALLATHGREILCAARKAQRLVRFEAAIGSAMPVVQVVSEGLRANHITSIAGILNGTSNFVLSRMANEGMGLTKAVKIAQQEGYAELDPALDLSGEDAAHKIALLATLAYGKWCDFSEIPVEGIMQIMPADIAAAKQLGCCVKLVASAREDEDGTFDVRVAPALVPLEHHLGQVEGAFNAVEVDGDFAGELRLFGMGAGMIPTASAVAADVLEIAKTIATSAGTLPQNWPNLDRTLQLADTSNMELRYFVRIPGVKRGTKKLLVDTLRSTYVGVDETFRVSGFTAAVTGEAREGNLKRAMIKLCRSVDKPAEVYSIRLL